jgi:hypothetical protein
MSQTIDFREFGCKEQPTEFYEDLEKKFACLDELDKSRVLLFLTSKIFTTEMKLHPLVIMKLMENLQNIEINCAKMKKLLADTKVKSLTCKTCGKVVPEMTMLMICQGVNQKCPHDEIEIEIIDKTE